MQNHVFFQQLSSRFLRALVEILKLSVIEYEGKFGKSDICEESFNNNEIVSFLGVKKSVFDELIIEMVSFGIPFKEMCIKLLISLCPMIEGSVSLNQKLDNFLNYRFLYNHLLMVFISKCFFELLVIDPQTLESQTLISLCYDICKASFSGLLSGSFLIIVQQMSLVLSILSYRYLEIIICVFSNQTSSLNKKYYLYMLRYIRLSFLTNGTVDQVSCTLVLLNNFGKNNKNSDCLKDWFIVTKTIVSQFNKLTQLLDIVNDIVSLSISNLKTQNDYYVLQLLAVIFLRDDELCQKHYPEFWVKKVFKKSTIEKSYETSLLCFHILIQGTCYDEGLHFINCNSLTKTNGKNFFVSTNFDRSIGFCDYFLHYFLNSDQLLLYPDLVSSIIYILCLIDFHYFVMTVIPSVLKTLSGFKNLKMLFNLFVRILNNKEYIEYYCHQYLNSESISSHLLMQDLIKQLSDHFQNTINENTSKDKLSYCYNVSLSKNADLPVFYLPKRYNSLEFKELNVSPLSSEHITQFFSITLSPSRFELPFFQGTINKASHDEEAIISRLSLIPFSISIESVKDTYITLLVSNILSSSLLVSEFSVRILNYVFVTMENYRLIIFESLSNILFSLDDPVHVFVLSQIFYSFIIHDYPNSMNSLDLNLLLAYLLTFPCPEIRTISVMINKKLSQRSTIMNTLLLRAISEYSKEILKNSLKAEDSLIKSIPIETSKDLCICIIQSKHENLYRKLLAQIFICYQNFLDIDSLLEYNHISLNSIKRSLGKKQLNEEFYLDRISYLLIFLTYSTPFIQNDDLDLISTHISDLSRYFRFLDIGFFKKFAVIQSKKAICQTNTQIIQLLLSLLSSDNVQFDHYSSCFSCISWQCLINLFDTTSFNSFLTDQNSGNSSSIIVSSLLNSITKCFGFSWSMILSSRIGGIFISMINLMCNFFSSYWNVLTINKNKISEKKVLTEITLRSFSSYLLLFAEFNENLIIATPSSPKGPVIYPVFNEICTLSHFSEYLNNNCILLAFLYQNNIFSEYSVVLNHLYRSINTIMIFPDSSFLKNFENIFTVIFSPLYNTKRNAHCSLLTHFEYFIKLALDSTYSSDYDSAIFSFNTIYSIFCNNEYFNIDSSLSVNDIAINKSITDYLGNIIVVSLVDFFDSNLLVRKYSLLLIKRVCFLGLVFQNSENHQFMLVFEEIEKISVFSLTASIIPTHVNILLFLSSIMENIPIFIYGIMEESLRSLKYDCSKIVNSLEGLMLQVFYLSAKLYSTNEAIDQTKSYCSITVLPDHIVELLIEIFPQIGLMNQIYVKRIFDLIVQSDDDFRYYLTMLQTKPFSEEIISVHKMIILQISIHKYGTAFNILSGFLSFNEWVMNNVIPGLNNNEINYVSISPFVILCYSSLIDLMIISFENSIPYLHLILFFSIVFHESIKGLSIRCFNVIFDSIKGTPEALLDLIGFYQNHAELLDISDLTDAIIHYFAEKGKRIVMKLGNESLKWMCYYPYMDIAMKALNLFSKILYPCDNKSVSQIVFSIQRMVKWMPNINTTPYISSFLHIINKLCFSSGFIEKKNELIRFLNSVVYVFLDLKSQPRLLSFSLPIMATFLSQNEVSYSYIISLVNPLSFAMSCCEASMLLPLFFSLFNPKICDRIQGTVSIEEISLILFIPLLIGCFESFYNHEPYVQYYSDRVIKYVFEIALQLKNIEFIPLRTRNLLYNTIKRRKRTNPVSFKTQLYELIILEMKNTIDLCTDYLYNIASGTNVAIRTAVFSMVSSILLSSNTLLEAQKYSKIIFLSLKYNEGVALSLISSKIILDNKITFEPEIEVHDEWSGLKEKLSVAIDQYTTSNHQYESFNDLSSLIPLLKETWNSDPIIKARSNLFKKQSTFRTPVQKRIQNIIIPTKQSVYANFPSMPQP